VNGSQLSTKQPPRHTHTQETVIPESEVSVTSGEEKDLIGSQQKPGQRTAGVSRESSNCFFGKRWIGVFFPTKWMFPKIVGEIPPNHPF